MRQKLLAVTEMISYRSPKLVWCVFRADDGNTYPICPRCNCPFEREFTGFCDRCGQRLDWMLFPHAVKYCVASKKV